MNDMIELDEGSVIGNYRIVRLLGQGGMGTVYEVEHLELGTHYAIKTFTFDPENDASDALKKKFLEEGKLLARLKHPNLTHVFDLGFEEGSQMPYFVMDLVVYEDGETYTAEDIDLKDIDENMVYNWFVQLASALDYIHGEGIVHRDIKPSNLLVDKDLNVVLTDFGISRIFGSKIKSEVEATRTMVSKTGRGKLVLGTEHYIAPEVANGEEATPQADAYSLGVMLLRWLTGFYYGDNPGAIGLLGQKKYLWLPVIARLLAPTPDRRPETYSNLVKQLKPIAGRAGAPRIAPALQLASLGGYPRPPQESDEQKRKKKRNKAIENILAASVGLIAVGMLAVGGYFAWQYVEKKGAERDRQVAELKQQMAADKAAAEKKEAEEKAEAERKAAEEKRIVEEKEAARKATLAKQRQDEENAREKIAKNANAAVRETPDVNPVSSTPEKKREFIQEATVAEEKDYGPIPNKKYTWLMNGNADAPQKQTFLLANGAKFELMPQKAATFYMTNEPDDLKGWHKVTLTRPFWVTRTCVTVDQWREFAPNDCEDCRDVEKALDGKALLYIRLPRKSIDEFCAYLTAKYAKQLPKGYVFRLPSEAEWEYVQDADAVANKYEKLNHPWREAVSIWGETFQERYAPIRDKSKVLMQRHKRGDYSSSRYVIGGLSMPTPSGVIDMYQTERLVLDVYPRGINQFRGVKEFYADSMVDPLLWGSGLYDLRSTCVLTRDWINVRSGHSFESTWLCHIVLGPDLIGEKAWQNKRENLDIVTAVPRQRAKFDPTKIKNKISKPREVALKRVGGKEMIFCEIPKGKFNMSNVDGQQKAYHRVELTKPFWMSKFLVTADEWREYAPNDFNTRDVKAAERLFPKNPVSMPNSYRRWEAYCDFLNKRYGALLPMGYVFRLPTEAEWEWVFIADEKGDVRMMAGGFNNDNEHCKTTFAAMIKKTRAANDLQCDLRGFIGDAYIGGRTWKTGFGIYDIANSGRGDITMLDTYDAQCQKGNPAQNCADPILNIVYQEKEIDPVHYDGQCSGYAVTRNLGGGYRWLGKLNHHGYVHIVIAPDILKPLKEMEVAPFPKEDYGGVFLGDEVKLADISSKHRPYRNTEEQFKRMVSRENVLAAHFDKTEDTRGFHTEEEDSPWILLDLGRRCTITGIVIDSFLYHTQNLCIWVSDDGKHEKLVDKEDLMRKRYRIDLQKKNVKGRYIRIGREPKIEKNWFFLDKVVIYGKEK